MKKMLSLVLTVLLGGCLVWAAPVCAQDKTKTETTQKEPEPRHDLIPVRVQVVFAEYEGEKKISSLPYALLVNADRPRGSKSSIRMGLRVPIETSNGPNGAQVQYVDLGTNLDGWATPQDDGRFALHLALERSSAYAADGGAQKPTTGLFNTSAKQPVIQQFKSDVDLLIRDGQTVQSTMASDPISGRVSRVEVTLNVIK
jgi:hypothetical protein